MANENEKKPDADKEPAAKPEAETPAQQMMSVEQYNKAATAREKRFLKDIEAKFAGMFAKQNSPAPASEDLDEDLEETDKEPAAVKAEAPKADPVARKALARMKELEKRLEKEKEEATKKEHELMAKQETSDALQALSEARAINPKQALAVLKAEGRLLRTDSGELVVKLQKDIAGEKFDEEVPLAQGVRDWLSTEEGKLFQPPKGTEGSGANPTQKGQKRSSKDMSKQERLDAAGKTLLNFAMRRPTS